jgi:hypothetical protein
VWVLAGMVRYQNYQMQQVLIEEIHMKTYASEPSLALLKKALLIAACS